MVQRDIPLNRSRTFDTWLREEDTFFPGNPMLPIRGFPRFLLPQSSFHGINNTNREVPRSWSTMAIPKSMCTSFRYICITHEPFVIDNLNESCSPQVNHNCFVPYLPNECSFILVVHTFPHLSLRFGVTIPYHLVMIDLGGEFFFA